MAEVRASTEPEGGVAQITVGGVTVEYPEGSLVEIKGKTVKVTPPKAKAGPALDMKKIKELLDSLNQKPERPISPYPSYREPLWPNWVGPWCNGEPAWRIKRKPPTMFGTV